MGFLVGLGVGLLVAMWVSHKAESEMITLNKSIHSGAAVPDENGHIGWTIK